MAAVLQAHGEAEVAHDVEETMTTVCADPHYELPSLGWRVDGREAVTEMYRRSLHPDAGEILGFEARLTAVSPDALVNEIIARHETKHGLVICQSCVVIAFEGDMILGERIYMDTNFADLYREVLGEDFGDVPGVSPLRP